MMSLVGRRLLFSRSLDLVGDAVVMLGGLYSNRGNGPDSAPRGRREDVLVVSGW